MPNSLANRVHVAVDSPDDAGYAAETAVFNTAEPITPDLVVAVETAADVIESVRYAGELGLRVSVQSTGHGHALPITSGLVISTKRLDHLSIDPDTRIATLGAGVQWGAVIAAAAEHGLAPIAGAAPTVGVVGLLTGGGLGPLARSHGFGSDHVTGFSVVTGTGTLIEADHDHHPDLFWALRGGKLGLGIVTEVRLRLVPLPTLYGGSVMFAEESIEAALRGWIDWTASADSAVSTSVAIMNFPPVDAIPAPLRGRRLLSLRFAYPGPADRGAQLAAPLLALAPIYLGSLGDLPAAEIGRIHNDPTEPAPSVLTGMLLDRADQHLASALLDLAGPGTDTPIMSLELRHLGAATSRDVEEGSAVGGRSAAFTLVVIGVDPATFRVEFPAAVQELTRSLRPWISAETNINFAGRRSSSDDFDDAWPPATLVRLTEIRRKYDPAGVLA